MLKNPAAHPASLLPNAIRQEPHAHHQADDARRRQLGDGAHSTGYRHISPNSEISVRHDEPPRADAHALIGLRHRAGRHQHQERQAHEEQAERELAGTDGSRGPRRIHIHAKIGAKMMTKIGCTDWNHDEGTRSRRRRAACSDRQRDSASSPACS